ncbi:50S ribosomal protein L9 [Staphylococcus equorum]|nr:50S ribosomal protein L9 [Staphylococcus equorum]
MVTRVISRWATEYNIYFKRYSSDQFVAYLNQRILKDIEESNFSILSQLREKSVGYRAQLTLSVGVGEGGKLFGSVSTKQITQALQKQHDIKIDKRKMDLPNGIHALGYTNVPVKLDKEVEGTIRVHTVEQ